MTKDKALDKMADNARELGLDYEPDIPFGDNNPGLQWDEVPQAFNDWWDSEYDPTGNPFGKDTPAYWAWAGWKAAKQSAQQEPAPGYCKHCKQYTIEELLPAQRTWVGLTDEEKSDIWCVMTNRDFVTEDTHVYADAIEARLKEKNT